MGDTRTVGLKKGKVMGSITFSNVINKKVKFSLDFRNKSVKKEIEQYLNTVQDFWIPESNNIDDYRIDKEKPTKTPMYFSLALSTLYAKVGVWVIWEEKEK